MAAFSTSATDPATSLRVQVASFNFNLQGTAVPFPDLQQWLVPTISEARGEYTTTSMSSGREAPDIYAVGFQELVPLHMAFASSQQAEEVRAHTGREIRRAVRHHAAVTRPDGMYPPGSGPEDYTVIAEVHLVSISLYVLGRHRSGIPARVKEVRTSTASTGFFNVLGNKGGVGARIVLSSEVPGNSNLETETKDEVLTFVCAHLAAHDHNTQRRNQDYKTIVSRLAFTPESAIAIPVPLSLNAAPDLSKAESSEKVKEQYEESTNLQKIKKTQSKTGTAAALDKRTYSLYDTHHVFFFGDLNYRIALGESLTKHDVQRKISQTDFTYLAKHDQLVKQHQNKNVLHGLQEFPLVEAKIPPTYKYKPVRKESKKSAEKSTADTDEKKTAAKALGGDQLSPKRIPGWTDRIFWASAGKDVAQVDLFRSIMSYRVCVRA